MKIISCASFNGSGSSAVTDLIAEYSDVHQSTNYEFRFLHDPDGIMDLEYHLVQNHNRENSGHALKKFLKLSDFNARKIHSQYEETFKGHYMKLTKKYVDKLTDFSYKGWWFFDLYDLGFRKYHRMQAKNHLLRKVGLPGLFMRRSKIYCSHPSEDRFLEETREYVHALMTKANSDNKEFIEFDQLFPSQNINKALRYFSDEVYVIVVDRDPRDTYSLYRNVYKEGQISFKSAEDFCTWFRYIREAGVPSDKTDSERILHIHFEDLVFNYDETVRRIESFCHLDSNKHENMFSRFNPKRSAVNTRIYEKFCSKREIKYIEERLSDYLYDFESVSGNEIKGLESSDNSVF